MNFGEIKSFLQGTSLFGVNQANGERSPVANSKAHQGGPVGSRSAIVEHSSMSSLSFNILNKVVAGKLASLDPQAPPPPAANGAEQSDDNSLFDFKEVAKNVLSFVEKALNKAKTNGADNDALTTMMEKARKGVEDGFSQARDELGSMGPVSDEIEQGIGKSYDAIQDGLDRIEKNLFGDNDSDQDDNGSVTGMIAGVSEINYSRDRSSALSITTNDGDKVTINFADALRYSRSEGAAVYASGDGQGNGTVGAAYQMSESRYQAVGFSFSVEGELDDNEKAAIGSLVQDVSKLADEFFNGDLDKAFEQASQLGYDDSELSGFALNMSRVESVSVAAAYQQVAQYEPNGAQMPRDNGKGNDNGDANGAAVGQKPNLGQLVKPLANYFKDLMEFIDKAREKLNDGSDLQSLVDGSVGRYLEFRGEKNIPSALERFAQFNQKLLGALDNTSSTSSDANATEQASQTQTQSEQSNG